MHLRLQKVFAIIHELIKSTAIAVWVLGCFPCSLSSFGSFVLRFVSGFNLGSCRESLAAWLFGRTPVSKAGQKQGGDVCTFAA